MRRSLGLVAAFVAAAAGGGVGWTVHGRRAADLSQHLVDAEVACARFNLQTLERIQAGDLDGAQRLLESALSLNVAILDEWSTAFGRAHTDRIRRTLRRISDYRNRYPYLSGDADADSYLQEILDRAS